MSKTNKKGIGRRVLWGTADFFTGINGLIDLGNNTMARMKWHLGGLKDAVKEHVRPAPVVNMSGFDEIKAHYGLTDADLEAKMNAFRIRGFCLAVISILLLAHLIYRIVEGGWSSLIYAVIILALGVMMSLKDYWRADQIERRELMEFRDWFILTRRSPPDSGPTHKG